MIDRFLRLNVLVIPLLIGSLLASCAATRETVILRDEPSQEERDVQVWFLYYQQELKLHPNQTDDPPETYPAEAKEGYARALHEWRITMAKGGTMTLLGIVVGIWVVIQVLPRVSPGGFSWR